MTTCKPIEELEALLKRHPPRRRAQAGDCVRLVRTGYDPWAAQRIFHRPRELFFDDEGRIKWLEWRYRLIVAARQTGKTVAGANELLRVMLAEPGSYSALLAPTYKIAAAAIDKVREQCNALGLDHTWKEQKKRLEMPNGSVWAVFSADRRDTVRGPTIDGILWIDEGAFLSEAAMTAAMPALAGNLTGRVVVTTTPRGRNWVYKEWTSDDKTTLKLRFRSVDSPYSDHEWVEKMRKNMSKDMFAQEFEAVFVDSLLLPFPPELREQLWVASFPQGARPSAWWIGIDLDGGPKTEEAKAKAKKKARADKDDLAEKDWTVLTLIDDLGNATPLDRWQGEKWPIATKRIARYCKDLNATPVIERGGHGGGPATVLVGYLEKDYGIKAITVPIGTPGTKGAMVEQVIADAQFSKLRLLRNEHFDTYDHELAEFQGRTVLVQGREIKKYEGPRVKGEHDDCVISLCLANYGRHNTEAKPAKTSLNQLVSNRSGRRSVRPKRSHRTFF